MFANLAIVVFAALRVKIEKQLLKDNNFLDASCVTNVVLLSGCRS